MTCYSLIPGACERLKERERQRRAADIDERNARNAQYRSLKTAEDAKKAAREANQQVRKINESLEKTQKHAKETETELSALRAKYLQLLNGSQIYQQKTSARVKSLEKIIHKAEQLTSELQGQKRQIGKCLSNHVSSDAEIVRCIAGVLAGSPPTALPNFNKIPALTPSLRNEEQSMPVDVSTTTDNR